MDWKSLLDDLKSQTDGVLKQAEAKYAELKKNADADGDGVPDALQATMAQARRASESPMPAPSAVRTSPIRTSTRTTVSWSTITTTPRGRVVART